MHFSRLSRIFIWLRSNFSVQLNTSFPELNVYINLRLIQQLASCSGDDLPAWYPRSFIINPSCGTTKVTTSTTELSNDTSCRLTGVTENNVSESDAGIVKNNLPRKSKPTDQRQCLLDYATENSPDLIWIAKSSSGAKGGGIKMAADAADLLEFIDSQPNTYIVQQYITNPLLLDHGRKFDMRCVIAPFSSSSSTDWGVTWCQNPL